MADIESILLPNGTEYSIRDDSKLPKNGGTMIGNLKFNGSNLNMGGSGHTSGDLTFMYGQTEKARIYIPDGEINPRYRCFNSSVDVLYQGTLAIERTVTKTYSFPAGGAVYIYKFGRIAVFKINGVGIGIPAAGYVNVMTLDQEDCPIDTFYSEWTNFRNNSPEYFILNPSGVVQLVGPKNTETTWYQNIVYVLAA